MPVLGPPTAAVRDSFLAGERALCLEAGTSPAWLDEAAADFRELVARCRATRHRWGVPVTELWYLDGPVYLGTVMIRHSLTPELRRDGGNIGYHVVPAHRRQGHATAMLAAACGWCAGHGMTVVLVTCAVENVGSRHVIEANGGVLSDNSGGICRYQIIL